MLWKRKVKYSDEEIIKGFRNTDSRVLSYVYSTYYKIVEYHVVKNGGRKEYVKDLFQDTLSIAYDKIREENFELTCTFGTFIFSISKKLWFYELRKMKSKPETLLVSMDDFGEEPVNVDELEALMTKQRKLFRKHFDRLDELCKNLILLFLKKVPFKEIAEQMGFKDEMTAVRRKLKCKDSLMRKILNDPEYKNL